MQRFLLSFGSLFAAALLCLGMAGCPTQAGYQSTITPIYAATNNGLWVFDGTSWRQYTAATMGIGLATDPATSVVVSGSGTGAEVFVATSKGVSYTNNNASTWTNWAGGAAGLGAAPVNRLFLGSDIYAATTGGLSVLNDLSAWTTDAVPGSANDVYCNGSFTFVGTNAGLYVYNGTGFTHYTTLSTPSIPNNSVTAVVGYSSSAIYAGTTTGLYTFHGTAFSPAVPAITASVRGLFVDTYGNLFAATDGGLYVYGYSTALLSDPTLCGWVDGAGTIYADTSGNGLQISKDGGTTWTAELTFAQTGAVNSGVSTVPLYSF